jgi:hypothetical protein
MLLYVLILFLINQSSCSQCSTLSIPSDPARRKADMRVIIQNIPDIQAYPLRYIFEVLLYPHQPETLWLEFGVGEGSTISYISKFTNDIVYGFYSLRGLPENWRDDYEQGKFDQNEIPPPYPGNVQLQIGLFNETLPSFLSEHLKKISFLHVKCDLYSSAKYVLNSVKDRLAKDAIIIFDKLVSYPDFDGENGELRAFYEWITENDVQYEWIGTVADNGIESYQAVAARIHSVSPHVCLNFTEIPQSLTELNLEREPLPSASGLISEPEPQPQRLVPESIAEPVLEVPQFIPMNIAPEVKEELKITENENIEEIMKRIQNARQKFDQTSISNLLNITYLENIFIPEIGLNNELYHEFPSFLYPYMNSNTGLRIWQYPSQLSKYLLLLANFQIPIKSYLEIGVRHGGTFIFLSEYMNRIGKPFKSSIGIDIVPSKQMELYISQFTNSKHKYAVGYHPNYKNKNSEFYDIDLCFIDGDHSFLGVTNDYSLIKDHCKYIVFHDVYSSAAEGSTEFWRILKFTHSSKHVQEIIDQYPEVMEKNNGKTFLGFGILQNKCFCE